VHPIGDFDIDGAHASIIWMVAGLPSEGHIQTVRHFDGVGPVLLWLVDVNGPHADTPIGDLSTVVRDGLAVQRDAAEGIDDDEEGDGARAEALAAIDARAQVAADGNVEHMTMVFRHDTGRTITDD